VERALRSIATAVAITADGARICVPRSCRQSIRHASTLARRTQDCASSPGAKNAFAQYSAAWWLTYPYCFGGLLALDHMFKVFDPKANGGLSFAPEDKPDWRAVFGEPVGPDQDDDDELPRDDNVNKFDPRRFQGGLGKAASRPCETAIIDV
jgi:hypothetical protein